MSIRPSLKAIATSQKCSPDFIRIFNNDLAAGYYLTCLVHYQSMLDNNGATIDGGWFYHTIQSIERRYAISRRQQERIEPLLIEKGILKKKVMGWPAKKYFLIDYDALDKFTRTVQTEAQGRASQFTRPVQTNISKDIFNKKHNSKEKLKNNFSTTSPCRASSGKDGLRSMPEVRLKLVKRDKLNLKQYLDYWNKSGLRKHLNPDTKVYQNSLKLLRLLVTGRLFKDKGKNWEQFAKPYTFEDFQIAVDNFAQEATDPKLLPLNKSYHKSMNLDRFLFDSWAEKGANSPFLNALHNPPKIVTRKGIENINPILTEKLLNEFNLAFSLTGDNPRVKYNLTRLSNYLTNTFDKNKSKIEDPLLLRFPKKQAVLFFTFLKSKHNGSFQELDSFQIAAPYLQDDFIAWMKKQGVIKQNLGVGRVV